MRHVQLLIVGASARAAAQSAARCGLTVATADLFADADLPSAEDAQRIKPADYPNGFLGMSRGVIADAWLYTGGLENYPQLVDQLSRRFPIAGVSATALRRVRDPHQLTEMWARRAIRHPAVIRDARPCATVDRQWLRKPLGSTGGRGIRPPNDLPLDAQSADPDPRHADGCYWQELITGLPAAGIFLADGRHSRLCGVTRQWTMADLPVALRPPDSHPYQYVGSAGPLPLAPDVEQQWAAIGQAVTQDFRLRGLFGVDAIMQQTGCDNCVAVLPLEVNPRYTASVEVLERALHWRAIDEHLAACFHGHLRSPDTSPAPAAAYSPFCAKLILFARRDLVVRRPWLRTLADANRAAPDRHWPTVADIPHPGTRIRCGQPICTLLTSGPSIEEIRQRWGLAAGASGEAHRWLAQLEMA